MIEVIRNRAGLVTGLEGEAEAKDGSAIPFLVGADHFPTIKMHPIFNGVWMEVGDNAFYRVMNVDYDHVASIVKEGMTQ